MLLAETYRHRMEQPLHSLSKDHFLATVASSKSFRDQLLDVYSARG